MHLVEILLPLNDNSGPPFGAEKYAAIPSTFEWRNYSLRLEREFRQDETVVCASTVTLL